MSRHRMLYLSSSSYSGSTLLAFVLNTHPEIFTISEMEGWPYDPEEGFRCSCGSFLERCPFFNHIERAYQSENIEFQYEDFGTAYKLSSNNTLNRILTRSLPLLTNSRLERVRDKVVRSVPSFRKKFDVINKKNRIFLNAALKYSGAKVFLDATKNPYRIRHLRRIQGLDLGALYLVRDIRGVAFSNMRKLGWGAEKAAKAWIQDQRNILRILHEMPGFYTVRYEELCDDVDKVIRGICDYTQLSHKPFSGNFRTSEHHILGNVMRLQETGVINMDTRWKKELTKVEYEDIINVAMRYIDRNRGDPVSRVISSYLG